MNSTVKTLAVSFTLALMFLSGCAGYNPYEASAARMQQASHMNSRIVNNALEVNVCPRGYVEVKNVTEVDKRVFTKYKEEIGRRGRGSGNFPYAESKAEDKTYGTGRITCERIRR